MATTPTDLDYMFERLLFRLGHLLNEIAEYDYVCGLSDEALALHGCAYGLPEASTYSISVLSDKANAYMTVMWVEYRHLLNAHNVSQLTEWLEGHQLV